MPDIVELQLTYNSVFAAFVDIRDVKFFHIQPKAFEYGYAIFGHNQFYVMDTDGFDCFFCEKVIDFDNAIFLWILLK